MRDIVIRGGLIVDGSGGTPYHGDVAIAGNRIVEVGEVTGSGRREIDARGLIVTPGFVDIHTHYDGQVLWSDHLAPSSRHGSTTVVMGNCAVGLAPCRPHERDLLIKVMSGVEDIPEVVMAEGLEWNWETFPDYLDVLEGRRCDADFAAFLAHGPLRIYAMGKRGARREPANADDLASMAQMMEEALRAGALGFSTSRLTAHKDVDGNLGPAETAAEEELLAIARAMRRAGRGVIEYITEFPGLASGASADFDLMCRVAEAAGRPLSYTLVQAALEDGWRSLLELTDAAVLRGIDLRGQVAPRAVGINFGLDLSYNPFSFRKSYREIASLPLAERLARMRDPELRRRILAEPSEEEKPTMVLRMAGLLDRMYILGDPPDYEPPRGKRLDVLAAAAGKTVQEFAYDTLLEQDGRQTIYLPAANYLSGSLDPVKTMMDHPRTVIALGDGGAHYGLICDASYPTFCLTHWVRDRNGPRISLETMVRYLTRDPAETCNLRDRGLIEPGYKADLNVIDFERLALHGPTVHYDLPAGGRRMAQRADGYIATVVSGQVTCENGEPAGTLPGRLIRGEQSDPIGARR